MSRAPGMSPATLARLAVAGNRTDLLRTVLTAVSASLAAVALLAAATVISIHGWAERYTNPLLIDPGLRPGVMAGLILVAFPVLALAGQCVRLGAPARDRRLAAIRLAGATPGEAMLIATAETVAASLVGSVCGLGAYLVGRQLLDQRDRWGQLRLPADVLPPVAAVVPILLFVPLAAATIGALLMRRVIVTPLGVVRRVRERGPRPWPGLVLAVGLAFFGVTARQPDFWDNRPKLLISAMICSVAMVIGGVVLGTGWLSGTAGRLLRRFGRGPAALLAAQRLITDPWNGSRTLAALLATVISGGVALGYRAHLAAEFHAYDLYNMTLTDGTEAGAAAEPSFYFGAIRLVMVVVGLSAAVAAAGMLVALTESIVARRRTYAALTAAGVPRRTLSAALLWQTLTPLVPALLLALGSGFALVRLTGTTLRFESVVVPVEVPAESLALLGVGALLAVLLAAGAGLLVLRSSTDLEELRV
jgi:hypothetical protein